MPAHLTRDNDPGHVHFWTISTARRLGFFHHDEMKQTVVAGLRQLQTKFGICVVGYVVMPEHVHVLLYPHARRQSEPTSVSTLLRAFKQYVGFCGKACLRDYWRMHGRLWSDPLTDWAVGRAPNKPIWNTRGYDFNIHQRDTLIEKVDYSHKNPVTRGFVERPEDWRWSSYWHYGLDDRAILAMDWDGVWPIVWQHRPRHSSPFDSPTAKVMGHPPNNVRLGEVAPWPGGPWL